jgi:hypothetical protein
LAEGLGVLHAGLAEGKIVFLGEGFLVGIFKELGFGGGEAAEGPFAANKVVEEDAGFGGGGVVAVIELGCELLEVGEVLGGEDEGLGVNAGFEGVHGGSGLACDRGGAGGFLGVTTIGFYLTESGHVWLQVVSELRSDAQGRALCHFEDRVANLGIRGWMAVSD